VEEDVRPLLYQARLGVGEPSRTTVKERGRVDAQAGKRAQRRARELGCMWASARVGCELGCTRAGVRAGARAGLHAGRVRAKDEPTCMGYATKA